MAEPYFVSPRAFGTRIEKPISMTSSPSSRSSRRLRSPGPSRPRRPPRENGRGRVTRTGIAPLARHDEFVNTRHAPGRSRQEPGGPRPLCAGKRPVGGRHRQGSAKEETMAGRICNTCCRLTEMPSSVEFSRDGRISNGLDYCRATATPHHSVAASGAEPGAWPPGRPRCGRAGPATGGATGVLRASVPVRGQHTTPSRKGPE